MSNATTQFDYKKLSVDDRIQLAQDIWDSISDDEESFELTDAQRDELRRRKRFHEDHPGEFLTWDEVKSQVLNGRKE